MKKIVYAGVQANSHNEGVAHLEKLAELTIPVKQVERLTRQIGEERLAERAALVAAWEKLPLAERERTPGPPPPAVAVVEMDGGRMQIRGPDWGQESPAVAGEVAPLAAAANAESPSMEPGNAASKSDAGSEPAKAGRQNHWREDKVGCLLSMTSTVSETDPCPEIPEVFVDPLRALALAQGIGKAAVPEGAPFTRPVRPEAEAAAEPAGEPQRRPGAPELQQRVIVASRQDNHTFGPMLAAMGWSLGLLAASRRAFVADGASGNWTVQKTWFPRFVPILDFLHALTYVYAAAMAGRKFAEGWPIYKEWIQWVWSGQVVKVVAALSERQQELGEVQPQDVEGATRRVLHDALSYLGNNQEYMAYDAYRRQGLPLMSSYVESTVKQINRRVKGTEKFWSEEGAEAILQLRGDYLSDTEPMEEFWERRQGNMTGQRRYRRVA